MSGRIVNVMKKSVWDFSFLASGTQTITLHRAMPVVPFYYYWLGLRVHNVNVQHASSSYILSVNNTLPAKGDPQEFTEGTAAMTLTVDSTSAVGNLLVTSTTNIGPFVKITLRAGQGSSGNRLYAELSAVLLGRIP